MGSVTEMFQSKIKIGSIAIIWILNTSKWDMFIYVGPHLRICRWKSSRTNWSVSSDIPWQAPYYGCQASLFIIEGANFGGKLWVSNVKSHWCLAWFLWWRPRGFTFKLDRATHPYRLLSLPLAPRRTMLHSKSPSQRPILVNFTIITSIALPDEERLHQV